LRLADLTEIPLLRGEKLERFYGLMSSVMHIYCNRFQQRGKHTGGGVKEAIAKKKNQELEGKSD